jgi:hypothetical protein
LCGSGKEDLLDDNLLCSIKASPSVVFDVSHLDSLPMDLDLLILAALEDQIAGFCVASDEITSFVQPLMASPAEIKRPQPGWRLNERFISLLRLIQISLSYRRPPQD